MIKGSIAGCLLVLTPLPALAGDFGGLTLTSTCDQYNESSGSNRAGFVHDVGRHRSLDNEIRLDS